MAAPESLYGLWIEQEIIMSPLHKIVKFETRTLDARVRIVERKLFRRKAGNAAVLLAPAGLSTTAPSGAANLSESGATASNTGSMPVLQLSMELGL